MTREAGERATTAQRQACRPHVAFINANNSRALTNERLETRVRFDEHPTG